MQKKISKTYPNGVQALKDVTLTVEQGEIVGLVGLNGAGKTTFVKIAVGVLEKDSGEISICGYQPISEQKKLSKMIAWIPQEGTRKLSTWLSGWDNIRYYCMNRGLSKQEIDKRIDNLLNIITHDRSFLKKQISIMSGGKDNYVTY